MKNIILFIVSLAMFMEAVDGTIINTAIPSMSISLHVDPIDLKLALISYLLSLAIFIPISGWVADKYGIKKIFISAVLLFTLSSLWCGFTNNLPELVIARFVQGMGGSLTLPVGRLIVVRICERHEYIAKMSMVVMVAAMGMMLGPVLGGIITHQLSWRWIFWVNVPVGFFTILLAIYLLPNMASHKVPKLDKLGFILFGSALALLTFGLSSLSESEIKNSIAFGTIAIAFLLFIFYALHSRNNPHPIVKISLLRYRTFRASILGNLLARTGFGGVPFLVPLLLQISLGYSPQTSGLLLAPTALGVLIVKPLSLHILRLLGYKKLLLINTFLMGFSLWSFAYITAETSMLLIACLTFAFGFLMALQYTGMNSIAYANITADELSSATSIMSTTQQISLSIGVAVAAILLRIFAAQYSENGALNAKIFHDTFFTMGILTFFSAIIFLNLRPEDGHELIDHPLKAEKSTVQT